MTFKLNIAPHRRAAARFVNDVTQMLQQGFVFSELTIEEIATKIDRPVDEINDQLQGKRNISLGRLAELVWALDIKLECTAEIEPPIPNVEIKTVVVYPPRCETGDLK